MQMSVGNTRALSYKMKPPIGLIRRTLWHLDGFDSTNRFTIRVQSSSLAFRKNGSVTPQGVTLPLPQPKICFFTSKIGHKPLSLCSLPPRPHKGIGNGHRWREAPALQQRRPPASRSGDSTQLLLVACDAGHFRSHSSSYQLQK